MGRMGADRGATTQYPPRVCERCGRENLPLAQTCSGCGSPLVGVTMAAQAAAVRISPALMVGVAALAILVVALGSFVVLGTIGTSQPERPAPSSVAAVVPPSAAPTWRPALPPASASVSPPPTIAPMPSPEATAKPRATPKPTPRPTPRPTARPNLEVVAKYLDDVRATYTHLGGFMDVPLTYSYCTEPGRTPAFIASCIELLEARKRSLADLSAHLRWMTNHPAACLRDAYGVDKSLDRWLQGVIRYGFDATDTTAKQVQDRLAKFSKALTGYLSDCYQ